VGGFLYICSMETKVCTKCGIEKELKDFHLHSKNKDGHTNQCRVCNNLVKKLSGSKKRASEKYAEQNKEILKEKNKQRYSKNKDNPEYKEKRSKQYQKNKDHYTQYKQNWYKNNKERLTLINREYYQINREEIIKKGVEYRNTRRNNDDFFKMIDVIRCTVKRHIKNKSMSTESILGCTYEKFVTHIESQFTEGMNWSNHGKGINKWNYDHIIPISSAKSEEELYNLNYYTNFQPMWEIDNLKKSNKIVIK
jgi:hypothetical protein